MHFAFYFDISFLPFYYFIYLAFVFYVYYLTHLHTPVAWVLNQ